MQTKFQFSDLHCHPNLKTYGHSFDKKRLKRKQNIWNYEPPNILSQTLNSFLGLTRFSQADFTTLSKGGAKVIFVSLYPFEKGFFINSAGKGPISAWLSNLVTGIGYERIRNLQVHTDYFKDLEKEYSFVRDSPKTQIINKKKYQWSLVSNSNELKQSLNNENEIAVLLSIEGAHVFNSGLTEFGRPISEEEILNNIRTVKAWEYPPFYITFAHNFNNDLCGHAESLEPIKKFVNQSKGMNLGFTSVGINALHELLSSKNGRPIYIDLKHMSLTSRIEYFNILRSDYTSKLPPSIVSHGAVNGLSLNGGLKNGESNLFYPSDINFYDEEIEHIGKYGGLFAIQFDTRRIANPKIVKKGLHTLFKRNNTSIAAMVIWKQIEYIAELLDQKGLFAWGTACIGSDYDGTINPLPGVWTAEYFPNLYENLLINANNYLKKTNRLFVSENRNITSEEILQRFFIDNAIAFLKKYF